jgi:hypothetical protein
MSSNALRNWLGGRTADLDEIEEAHRAVGGSGPGRRTATQQINQAYAVLLSSQFQAFCRELHDDCTDLLLAPVSDPNLRDTLRVSLLLGRKLDRGNPHPGAIGDDFGRLGLALWSAVEVHRAQNRQRRALLQELNEWRNAIAHQDFAPSMLKGGRPVLQLAHVQSWRKACDGLARSFDDVLRAHLNTMTGTIPW